MTSVTVLDDDLIDRAVALTPIIKLKALDCLYAAVAEQMNYPLFMWDRNIVGAAPKAGIRTYFPL